MEQNADKDGPAMSYSASDIFEDMCKQPFDQVSNSMIHDSEEQASKSKHASKRIVRMLLSSIAGYSLGEIFIAHYNTYITNIFGDVSDRLLDISRYLPAVCAIIIVECLIKIRIRKGYFLKDNFYIALNTVKFLAYILPVVCGIALFGFALNSIGDLVLYIFHLTPVSSQVEVHHYNLVIINMLRRFYMSPHAWILTLVSFVSLIIISNKGYDDEKYQKSIVYRGLTFYYRKLEELLGDFEMYMRQKYKWYLLDGSSIHFR